MKTIFVLVIASFAMLAVAGAANAKSYSGPDYMIGLQKDGHKLYKWTCSGSFCGNWNVKS